MKYCTFSNDWHWHILIFDYSFHLHNNKHVVEKIIDFKYEEIKAKTLYSYKHYYYSFKIFVNHILRASMYLSPFIFFFLLTVPSLPELPLSPFLQTIEKVCWIERQKFCARSCCYVILRKWLSPCIHFLLMS